MTKMAKRKHYNVPRYTTATGTFYDQNAEIRPSFYELILGIRYGVSVVGYTEDEIMRALPPFRRSPADEDRKCGNLA